MIPMNFFTKQKQSQRLQKNLQKSLPGSSVHVSSSVLYLFSRQWHRDRVTSVLLALPISFLETVLPQGKVNLVNNVCKSPVPITPLWQFMLQNHTALLLEIWIHPAFLHIKSLFFPPEQPGQLKVMLLIQNRLLDNFCLGFLLFWKHFQKSNFNKKEIQCSLHNRFCLILTMRDKSEIS